MDSSLGQLPYRHTQVGYGTLIGLVAGVATQTGSFIRDVRARRRRAWLYAPLMVLFAALMYAFSTLTTEVRDDEVEVSFTSGLARRRFATKDITEVDVVTIPWFSGWGIRLTPGGWLYNVWGRSAVRLTLANGGHFSIGSDEAEALAAAINTARGQARAAA